MDFRLRSEGAQKEERVWLLSLSRCKNFLSSGLTAERTCNNDDTAPQLYPDHFTWILQRLECGRFWSVSTAGKAVQTWPASAPCAWHHSHLEALLPWKQFHLHFQLSHSIFCPPSNLWCGFSPSPLLSGRGQLWLASCIIHRFQERLCTAEPPAYFHPQTPPPPPFPYLSFRTPGLPFQISMLVLGLHAVNTNLDASCETFRCSQTAGDQFKHACRRNQQPTKLWDWLALSRPTPATKQSADCQEKQERAWEIREEAKANTLTAECSHATQSDGFQHPHGIKWDLLVT